jgi:hypothetical protein
MSSIAQTPEDNLIIVTLQDTTNLYQRVRQAITFTDLVIRQDSKPDTLMTHSERIHNKSIFVIATVVIVGSKVKISGAFGLGQEDFWGYPAWPKSYKRATYFKGSEAFHILRRIAIKLDGKIEYARVD